MIDLALKAKIPIVSVSTDDPGNAETVLEVIAHPQTVHFTKTKPTVATLGKYMNGIFWTTEDALGSDQQLMEEFKSHGRTLVLVNCKPSMLAFDAGLLMPPKELMLAMCEHYSGKDGPAAYQVLKGMSLRKAEEVFGICSAKFGNTMPKNLRAIRMQMGATIQGLTPIETELDYYEPEPSIEKWVKLNKPYFTGVGVSPDFVPRGLLLDGPPGTGKTIAAKAIAGALGVPLYRLDIATTLTKYIGESEARLAQSLRALEADTPCVVLFDEVEKVFTIDGDSSVVERMLSQLLWWLSEHRSRVLTIMTTNDKKRIPPELYRKGRVDQVFEVPTMTAVAAAEFAARLFKHYLPGMSLAYQDTFLAINLKTKYSHSEVKHLVIDRIKSGGLLNVS